MVERKLAPDLQAAAGMIMAGEVIGPDRLLDKPGLLVDDGVVLSVRARSRYVSRGGDKLASVADELGLDFRGKVVLDVGSSTGGFTDFALRQGAAKVYCVDVGRAQLDYRLRQDARVAVLERTDIRELGDRLLATGADRSTVQDLTARGADLALIDVSFISLLKILPSVSGHVAASGLIAAMVKPQFEASKAAADRFKGVIVDEAVRQEILKGFEAEVSREFTILRQADSRVAGARGNVERFYVLVRNSTTSPSRRR